MMRLIEGGRAERLNFKRVVKRREEKQKLLH